MNPSELVARALDKRDIATSLAIKSYLFEVSEEAVSRMTDIVYVNDPKAVIHLGYENVAKGLRVEVAASNHFANNRTFTDGPEILPTTINLNAFALEHKLMEFSRDPGEFFCNEIYYRSLYYVRRNHPAPFIPVVFIHLPPLNLMTLDEQSSYVHDVIVEILQPFEMILS
eukprot:GEMP01091238.1.p1 GENE.GEMP01091238.1~~GEMP01091238.1.p1  ORF type:complete len:170 (+),score=25.42 GEMP01091238.1:138-647(+)